MIDIRVSDREMVGLLESFNELAQRIVVSRYDDADDVCFNYCALLDLLSYHSWVRSAAEVALLCKNSYLQQNRI
jgi:hypothetical protein